jgi:GAF domain-containing protein
MSRDRNEGTATRQRSSTSEQEPARLGRSGARSDTPPEEAFDDASSSRSSVLPSPRDRGFVDERRQFFKASVGIDVSETPREVSFCAHTLSSPGLCVIRDAQQDPRFVSNPLVTGGPMIRFYAAASLLTPEGLPLGTVCVADRVPRDPAPRQMEALRALANQVMTHLELRRHVTELARTVAVLERAEDALRDSEDRTVTSKQSAPDMGVRHRNARDARGQRRRAAQVRIHP